MINFFRKKRKKLADNNKTGKYMRYAIGEIVLVVIGILIALQINNWNEVRKISNQELHLLKSFKIGLEKDLSDINRNIISHRRSIASAKLIIKSLGDKQPYNDSLAKHFSYVTTPSRFVNSTSAFETLKSKGIDLISNENLRNEIITVYDSRYSFFLKLEQAHFIELNYGLREIFPSRFEESFVFDVNREDFRGRIIPINFELLKTDQEFLYFLKTYKNRSIVFVDFTYKKLKSSVSILIDDINSEIKKIEKD